MFYVYECFLPFLNLFIHMRVQMTCLEMNNRVLEQQLNIHEHDMSMQAVNRGDRFCVWGPVLDFKHWMEANEKQNQYEMLLRVASCC